MSTPRTGPCSARPHIAPCEQQGADYCGAILEKWVLEWELHLWLGRRPRQKGQGQGEPHSPGLRAVGKGQDGFSLIIAWCPPQTSSNVREASLAH